MSMTNALLSNLRRVVAINCPRRGMSIEELMEHGLLINIIANYRQLHLSEQEIRAAIMQGQKEAECTQKDNHP